MKEKMFSGVGVALVTPFNTNYEVDYLSLETMINHVINNGVDYIVCLGTTGESPTLSADEKQEILSFTVEKVSNRVPIVFGIGGNNTQAVLNNLKSYNLTGVAGILSVCPYYNKPTQEGIYQHFKALNDNTTLPIIAYNVPGRTGVNMTAATILRVANNCKNIVAVKDACSNISQNMDVVKNAPANFTILSGDDDLILPQLAIGMDGVISVAANCYTKDFCELVKLGLNGNIKEAATLHYKLYDAIKLLFIEGNPPGVKYVLSKMGLIQNIHRLPVVNISKEAEQKIDSALIM
jgi:4-hydroxy-tetrahydrodipicolinate synthase